LVAHKGIVSSCKITEVTAGDWQTNQPLNVTFQSKMGCFLAKNSYFLGYYVTFCATHRCTITLAAQHLLFGRNQQTDKHCLVGNGDRNREINHFAK
jgi:hypothetical protein